MEPSPKVRKRVREACENCRRKKGRCPGERPICSLCARLGQECTYAGSLQGDLLSQATHEFVDQSTESELNDTCNHDEPSHFSQQQFQTLDDKITEVLDQVRSLANGQPVQRRLAPFTIGSTVPPVLGVLPTGILRNAARLYLKYCHCQPIPLFSPTHFEATITTREPELCLAIAATSLRFNSEDAGGSSGGTDYITHSRGARSIIMARINDGKVELSTLQSLCLLAFASYNEGQAQTSGIYLSLLMELARTSRLDVYARQSNNEVRYEEHIRCLWSIIMLQYLSGGLGLMGTSIDTQGLRYPSGEATNKLASGDIQNSSAARESDKDLGVIAYAAQMTEAWYRVRQYIHHRGRLDSHPPWSGKSSYSDIMSRQMELESQMPHKHRFNPSGFAEHPVSMLSTNRLYWAPWLYLQLIYHSIVCTLNHPLFLSMHLRRFRVNQIPELFLQHISDMITSHTDWFIHLLNIAADKEFELSDPFLGRCVAIVATIYLQQSYTEDVEIRADKRSKYQICLDLVQKLGRYWPHIHELALDLQKFELTVSKAFQSSSINSPHLSSYVDMAAFWRIMDSNSMSATPSGSRSIFGPSLRLQARSQGESELLSTRMLPEPTRVHSLAQSSYSNASTPIQRSDLGKPPIAGDSAFDVSLDDFGPDLFNESPFLSQNFFALGQDFVGNADDWFHWTEAQ